MTLESLIGRRMISADGRKLGRIFGFRAVRQGRDVLITHLCIGHRAWLEALWPHPDLRRRFLGPPLAIPWEAVASAARSVTLKEGWTAARCKAPPPPANE